MASSIDDNAAAPRWLFPLVVAIHAAAAAALLLTAAPLVKPALRSLEVALLAPPAPAAVRAPAPSPTRPRPEQPPVATTPSPEPAPQAVPTPTPAAAVSPTSAAPVQAPEARPAATEAPAAPVSTPARFDAAYLNNPRPPYPPLARRMGEEGKAVLRVLVSPDGLAERVELAETAGSPRLDEAAVEAVRRWRFVPAREGDRAVAAWVRVPISFKLEKK